MRIYLAGGSSEMDRIRPWRDKLRERGWVITCDWIAAIEKAGEANPEKGADKAATADEKGIVSANVVWFFRPDISRGRFVSFGACYELGFARHHFVFHGSPRIVASGGPPGQLSIFETRYHLRFATDAEAFEHLSEQ